MFDIAIVWSVLPALGKGALLTLELTALVILFGTLLAFPLALAKNTRHVAARSFAHAYIVFFRGTPSLVQVFLLYYGAGQFQSLQATFLWPVLRDPSGAW